MKQGVEKKEPRQQNIETLFAFSSQVCMRACMALRLSCTQDVNARRKKNTFQTSKTPYSLVAPSGKRPRNERNHYGVETVESRNPRNLTDQLDMPTAKTTDQSESSYISSLSHSLYPPPPARKK